MIVQKITRETAMAQCLTHYFTGKACANGHISIRYTSGGNCVQCVKDTNAMNKTRSGMLARRKNAILSRDTFSYTMSIPPTWVPLFDMLQRIALRANPEHKSALHAIVDGMYKATHTPFVSPQQPLRPSSTVNKADILRVVEFDGRVVTNIPDLDITDITDDNPALIRIGLLKYPCDQIMKCLQGHRDLVHPYDSKTYIEDNND